MSEIIKAALNKDKVLKIFGNDYKTKMVLLKETLFI